MTSASRTAHPGDQKHTMPSRDQDNKHQSRSNMQDEYLSEQSQTHKKNLYAGNTHPQKYRQYGKTGTEESDLCQGDQQQCSTGQSCKDIDPDADRKDYSHEKHGSVDAKAMTTKFEEHVSLSTAVVDLSREELRQKLEKYKKRCSDLKYDREHIKNEFEGLVSHYGNLKADYKDLESKKKYFESRWEYASSKYFKRYAIEKKLQFDDRDASSIGHVLDPLLEDAMTASTLRLQVQTLQQEMFSNVEKVQSVPDEQFSRDFGTLAAAIKSFSRSIKLPPGLDISKIEDVVSCVLAAKVPTNKWSTNSRKKALIEGFVWSVLFNWVFRTPFDIFGPQCQVFSSNFCSLFGKEHPHHWPAPSELGERWRYTSVEQLLRLVGNKVPTEGKSEGLEPTIEHSVLSVRDTIRSAIETIFGPLSPTTDFSQLVGITNKAMTLMLHMSLQRSRIQVVFPDIGDICIQGKTPHLNNFAESEDVQEGTVAFIVNPGLAKWGNAHGKNLGQRLDLVPSLVFVEPLIEDEPKAGNMNVDLI